MISSQKHEDNLTGETNNMWLMNPDDPPLYEFPQECYNLFSKEEVDIGILSNNSNLFIREVTYERVIHLANATSLRRNPLYYNIYCVGLNTCFGTAFPLLSLLYLNIATYIALKKLGRMNQNSNDFQNETELASFHGRSQSCGKSRNVGWSSSNNRNWHSANQETTNNLEETILEPNCGSGRLNVVDCMDLQCQALPTKRISLSQTPLSMGSKAATIPDKVVMSLHEVIPS